MMRVCVALMVFAMLTSTADAQEQPARAESNDATASLGQVGRFDLRPEAGDQLKETLAPAVQQAPTPLPPRTGRRRGSMVGYIDDATVGSKLRIRFDSAFHNTVPDRAEFFYAKCGCYQDLAANNPAFDPDAPGPRPGAANDSDFQQLNVWGEYAVGSFVSIFGQLPVRWFQPTSFIPGTGAGFPNQSGLGDIRAGVKLALAADAEQSLTLQGQLYMPTGDASKALGTDHASFEPEFLYYRQLSDVATLESQFGVWIPFGGSAGVPTSLDGKFSGSVLSYGIGSGFDLYRRGDVQFGPVVELVGWHVLSGFQTAATSDADGTNIVNVKIGVRVSVAGKHSVYFGYGHHLTDATWYDDIVRFEYRLGL